MAGPLQKEPSWPSTRDVSRVLSEAKERAATMPADHRSSLDAASDLLLEKETIS
jgi:ATP-dependent Zn protease